MNNKNDDRLGKVEVLGENLSSFTLSTTDLALDCSGIDLGLCSEMLAFN
jgi:hypothetical protein